MSSYATKAAFARAVEMARAHGIEIGGFELKADGSIRIFKNQAEPVEPKGETLYDRLKREGTI